jgi:hypothetical protein
MLIAVICLNNYYVQVLMAQMYLYLLNISNPMYNQQLREVIFTPVRNVWESARR